MGNNDALSRLRKVLEDKVTDTFEVGTVIRWIANEKYHYAAFKTPVGWYTTSRYANGFVDPVLTFEGLVDVLARSESTEIMVSTDWEAL